MAVVYVAGLATGLAQRTPEVQTPGPVAQDLAPAPAIPVEPLSPEERAAQLKDQGDRYLQEWGDAANALACYRQVFELTPDARFAIVTTDDSWLYANLKRAAQEENRHEEI